MNLPDMADMIKNLHLSGEMEQKFSTYADRLVEKNAVMNLTAINDPEGIAVKHFVDSLLPLTLFDFPQGSSLVDVGAGAGFPSLPIGIARPDLHLTLIDSLNKRVEFLRSLADELGVRAECLHLRAEDAGKGIFRETFDIAIARAVAKMAVLVEYCLPLVKVGGVFLAMKGPDAQPEIKSAYTAIKALGGKLENLIDYTLPNGDRRTLAVVRKILPTPARYPRPSGKISTKPIGGTN